MLSDEDLDAIESKLKWSEEIDHGETLELGRKLMAMLTEVRDSRKWFRDHASVLASHSIGGFSFYPPSTGPADL